MDRKDDKPKKPVEPTEMFSYPNAQPSSQPKKPLPRRPQPEEEIEEQLLDTLEDVSSPAHQGAKREKDGLAVDYKEDAISSPLEEVLEDQVEEEEPVQEIRHVTQILKTQYRDDLVKSSSELVLTQTKKMLEQSIQKTMQLKLSPNMSPQELYHETLRLQKVLAGNLEYIENLGNSADQGIRKKKKALRWFKTACVILACVCAGMYGYYKFFLTAEQQEWVRSLMTREEKVKQKEEEVVQKEKFVGEKELQVVEKEKEVGQKEQLVVSKEKEVGQKELKVAEKEQLVVSKEKEVGQKAKEIGQKVKEIGQKEKKIAQREQMVEWQRKVLDQHLQLEDKIQEVTKRFQIQEKIDELKSALWKQEEKAQAFFTRLEGTTAILDPDFKSVSREFFVTTRQNTMASLDEEMSYLKWAANALTEKQKLMESHLKAIDTIRQNKNEDIEGMEKQIEKFSVDLAQTEQLIKIHEDLIPAMLEEAAKIERTNKEVETIVSQNLETFRSLFRNQLELQKLQESKSALLEKNPSKNPQDMQVVAAQKEALANIQKKLSEKYIDYVQDFARLSEQRIQILAQLQQHLPQEQTLSSAELSRLEVESQKKIQLIQNRTRELQKLYHLPTNFDSLPIEREIKESYRVLQSISVPVAETKTPLVAETMPPTEPKRYSPEAFQKALADMPQYFDISPSEYLMDVLFYVKEGIQFKRAFDIKFKILANSRGEGAGLERYFIAKTLFPKQERGNVVLKRNQEFWVYDIREKQVLRITPEGESGGDMKKKILNSLAVVSTVDPYSYTLDPAKIEPAVLNSKPIFRMELALKNNARVGLYPYILISLSQENLSPLKIEFCNESREMQKAFYILKYQDTEIGKKIATMQFLDANYKDVILYIQYSDIKKRDIPLYFFEQSYMTTFSSSRS